MSGEKTEEPTEEKLRQAREKGQVPGRKNILEAVILTVGVLAIIGFAPGIYQELTKVFDAVVDGPTESFDRTTAKILSASQGITVYVIAITATLGTLTLVMNLLLNKFNFAPKALEPKFEKLNPVAGAKNIFSLSTLYNFIRMTLIFAIISSICYFVIVGNMADGIDAASCGLGCLLAIFPGILMKMIFMILLVVAVFAAIDFRIQNALFKKQQKMSKDEVKREHKTMEGDPQIKGAQHSIAEENLYLPTMKEITHVVYSNSRLVALMHINNSAPYVVMKARGRNAPRLAAEAARPRRAVREPSRHRRDAHKTAKIGQFLEGKEAARCWYRVLSATGGV